jgi:hypothetical protein
MLIVSKFYSVVILDLKACLNESNILVQHHPTLLDATCWPYLNTMLMILDNCWLEFKLNNILVQHCAT